MVRDVKTDLICFSYESSILSTLLKAVPHLGGHTINTYGYLYRSASEDKSLLQRHLLVFSVSYGYVRYNPYKSDYSIDVCPLLNIRYSMF